MQQLSPSVHRSLPSSAALPMPVSQSCWSPRRCSARSLWLATSSFTAVSVRSSVSHEHGLRRFRHTPRQISLMCGIAGFIDRRLAGNGAEFARRAVAMGDAIANRGPDASGIWSDETAGVAFSHRRLSIVDLSEAGAQPMISADGRWVICYNGEIYNSDDMRRGPSLGSVAWRGHSDTETIVESVARRGVEATLDDINGMFAIALWDRRDKVLHLVRDWLAGGIDSSAIVGLMVAARRGRVRTFSIGFPEFGFDESKDAAAVARHLGTEHTELVVKASDALAVVPQLAQMYDEPFADSSQIPTYLVSKLTRRYVSVALSGDGGDELFGGYNRYRLAEGMWRRLGMVPAGARRAAS